ncbi:hypothetical protein DM860_000318 [Cuscuta australis]|uniref:GCK domain-containing protein n=1 Tax=Cuscuta australis TaxID=267555 RepID=A0A328CWM1_9ASTE|nr:hypothetical protein DM860_000318 [Cuscuta australis]
MGLRESRGAAAMEDNNLSAAKPNPSQPTATPPSKSGPNDGIPEPETLGSQPPIGESPDPPKNDQESQEDGISAAGAAEGEEEDEEEKGECGFCLFMKGGGCRETFIGWEKCVDEGEKNNEDIVEKCFKETYALKKCMEAHEDYYGPLLVAEKEAEAEAIRELEAEKGKEKAEEGNAEPEGSKKKEES